MKKFLTIVALSALLFVPNAVKATDYTIEPKADGKDPVKSRAIPMLYNTGNTWGSVSQQIYLASELTGQEASAGDINAITFYYSASSNIANDPTARDIQIFLMEIPAEQNAFVVKGNGKSDFLYVSSTNKTAGTKVYEGTLVTEAVTTTQTKTVKIDFDNSFAWNGTSNLVLTVFDMSATSNTVSNGGFADIRFLISKTSTARFLSWKWYSADEDNRAAWIADISGREGESWSTPTTVEGQTANRSYVNKVDFSITPAVVPTAPATPEDLAASPATTSASISWSGVSGATSYDLQQSANGSDWSALASSISGTSYNWTGLSASTTYYVRVRAVNAVGNSDWSDDISFTTDAVHSHNGINFERWNSTNSLPTSGNYYLNDDVELSAGISLSGNLNLCLNGHSVFSENNITIFTVPDEKTLAIYDNIGGGRIYGYYEVNPITLAGIITVEDGGTLILGEGSVENLDVAPKEGYVAYAIYNKGTLKLSGAPVISGHTADIGLFNSKYITIEEGKPLANTKPYKVNSAGQTITSGWANMDGANPCRYFTSAKTSYSAVVLNSGEVKLVTSDVKLIDSSDNGKKITDNQGVVSVLAMTRSITSAQYNTICLPFALGSDKMAEIFGVGYDLEEFVSSSLEDDVLSLTFAPRYSLEAGKPYLLKPQWDIINPTFENVTISVEEPDNTSDANISFHGTFSPTALTGGNKNLLFLGADNELFWPAADGNINGFRAYFEVKGAAAQAAKRARIVKKEDAATGIGEVRSETTDVVRSEKVLRNGQLIIIRDGKEYDIFGRSVNQ